MLGKTAERRRANDDSTRVDPAKCKGVFSRTPIGIALVDRHGRIVESNSALQRMLRCSTDNLRCKQFSELVDTENADSVTASLSKVITGELHEARTEARIALHGDDALWARLTISLLRENEDDLTRVVVIAEDISERKNAEEAFRFSEFKFRALFESNIVPLQFWHVDGRVLDANDAFLSLTGFDRSELKADNVRWDELIAPNYRDINKRALEELTGHKRPYVIVEKEYLLRDGRRIPVLVSLSLLPGHNDRGFGCAVDLTQQKLALKRSKENEALIQAVFSSLNGYIAVIDAHGNILVVNEAWADLTRTHERHPLAVGVGDCYFDVSRLAEEIGPDNAEKALAGVRAILRHDFAEFSMEYPSNNRWLQMIAQPLRRVEGGAIISHIDITERHRAEIEARTMRLELSHFARVAMMGELTASLAHELNQPLTAILTNAQAAQRLLNLPTPDLVDVREILDDIMTDGHRASETIRRVRDLLTKSEPKYQALDLNTIIVDVVGFINNEMLAKHVAVTMQLTPDLPQVRGDRIQLQQVILNIILNALDAMKDMPAGQRHIDIISAWVDKESLQVSIKDTGTGISVDTLDKIFDPFFTAKPDGMGMGLAICRSIVEGHGGRLWAVNNGGRGATFRFTLPIAREPVP